MTKNKYRFGIEFLNNHAPKLHARSRRRRKMFMNKIIPGAKREVIWFNTKRNPHSEYQDLAFMTGIKGAK